jgi:hypothetical protein
MISGKSFLFNIPSASLSLAQEAYTKSYLAIGKNRGKETNMHRFRNIQFI